MYKQLSKAGVGGQIPSQKGTFKADNNVKSKKCAQASKR